MIYIYSAVIAGGFFSLFQFNQISYFVVLFVCLVGVIQPLFPIKRYCLAFLIGVLWASLFLVYQQNARISSQYEKKPLLVEGFITNLPEINEGKKRFYFQIETAKYNQHEIPLQGMVLLNWYHDSTSITPGERWQLLVSLKAPRGYLNPHGFDYEKWLFSQRVVGKGYVRKSPNNLRVNPAPPIHADHIRWELREKLLSILPDSGARSVILALLIGDRSLISSQQWTQFSQLGINHLVAISGLHIGIIAWVFYYFSSLFWWVFPRLSLIISRQTASAMSALFGACLYSALAGFSISTQRALLMIALVSLALIFRYPIRFSHLIVSAMLLIFIWDPFALLSIGFWLSFMAVAIIAYAIMGLQKQSGWRQVIKIQLMISVLMIPVLLVSFSQFSVLSPLVNIVLIPLFSWLFIPLLLLLLPFVAIGFQWANEALIWLAFLLDEVFKYLTYFDQIPMVVWQFDTVPMSIKLALVIFLALVVLPRGIPRWGWGILISFPLIAYAITDTHRPFFRMTVLDVGQGTSVVIETAIQTWLYDTGASYPSGGSAAKTVILPFLNHIGVDRLDTLVISHADNDHAGGAETILSNIIVDDVISGEPIPNVESTPCIKGWQKKLDQVTFKVLAPQSTSNAQGNNRSCVVQISFAHQRILLTGDIERRVEQDLLKQGGIESNVIVVPHHGSATSSMAEFVVAVNPEHAISTTGYLNRWGFPRQEVNLRWRLIGAQIWDTAKHGAVVYECTQRGDCRMSSVRLMTKRPWRY